MQTADRYPPTHTWTAWPVNWSALWCGALSALAASLVFGLIGASVGASAAKSLTSWHDVSRIDVALAICSAFFAFVIGGWVAGKITGIGHSEATILHGAIAWLVALPLLIVMLTAGAGSAFGGWYGGVVTSPFVAVATAPSPDVVRNTALAALTALLVGLIGSVIGGWMASGEPMSIGYDRTRHALAAQKGTI